MHPILFKIGPVVIRAYGATVMVACLVFFLLVHKEAKRTHFYPEKIPDIALLILLFGMIGARLLHVLLNVGFYAKNPLDAFLIWQGGLAFQGGLILAIPVFIAFVLKTGMPLRKSADLVAPYLALGQSLGRIGCFLNGCCFGKPIPFYWFGVISPIDGVPRYATQLYTSLALLIIFVITRVFQKKKPFDGSVFALYLTLYSLQRFFMDYFRGDNPMVVAGLTAGQLISVGLLGFAALLFLLLRKKSLVTKSAG